MNYSRMSGPGDFWFQEPGWLEDHFETSGYGERLIASPSFREWAAEECQDVALELVAERAIRQARDEHKRHPTLGGPMTDHEKCEHLCAMFERDDWYEMQQREAA